MCVLCRCLCKQVREHCSYVHLRDNTRFQGSKCLPCWHIVTQRAAPQGWLACCTALLASLGSHGPLRMHLLAQSCNGYSFILPNYDAQLHQHYPASTSHICSEVSGGHLDLHPMCAHHVCVHVRATSVCGLGGGGQCYMRYAPDQGPNQGDTLGRSRPRGLLARLCCHILVQMGHMLQDRAHMRVQNRHCWPNCSDMVCLRPHVPSCSP